MLRENWTVDSAVCRSHVSKYSRALSGERAASWARRVISVTSLGSLSRGPNAVVLAVMSAPLASDSIRTEIWHVHAASLVLSERSRTSVGTRVHAGQVSVANDLHGALEDERGSLTLAMPSMSEDLPTL